METAVLTLRLITLGLMIILLFCILITSIKGRIDIRKTEEELNQAVEKKKETTKPQKSDYSHFDYENMNIAELKKMAQSRKIKGYYNLKKDQLIEVLKETEIIPK